MPISHHGEADEDNHRRYGNGPGPGLAPGACHHGHRRRRPLVPDTPSLQRSRGSESNENFDTSPPRDTGQAAGAQGDDAHQGPE